MYNKNNKCYEVTFSGSQVIKKRKKYIYSSVGAKWGFWPG